MKKDNIYTQLDGEHDFSFNSQVAEVFDDMVNRSIPNYQNILTGIELIALRYLQANSNFYDLGCSLATVTLLVRNAMSIKQLPNLNFIAIDLAQAMIDRAKLRLEAYKSNYSTILKVGDITAEPIINAGMVVMNFVLQFLAPETRLSVLHNVYTGLKPGGVLVLSEKINSGQLLIDLHHDFKKHQGYSQLEVERKRQALENVMKLENLQSHQQRLIEVGFSQVELWQQSYNFISLIAIK